MSCVTKTITMQAGENFVLPDGAEILFVSNSEAITSTDNCVVIPPTPAIRCYTFNGVVAGLHIRDNSGDYRFESFNYNGSGVGFNAEQTKMENYDGNVENIASEIWTKLKDASSPFKDIILGVSAFAERFEDGDLYGINIKMYDLNVGSPIVGIVDDNSYNAYTGEQIRLQSIGRIIDCGAHALDGADQHYACKGDIVCGPF